MKQYHTFDDLPEWVKKTVRRMRDGDEDGWIHQPVPALKDRSVMELMNQGEIGQQLVREYIATINGKFFGTDKKLP